MADLWQLSAPWWHFVLRGTIIYLLVTVLLRLSGKRAIGQFTPFDMILLILIGNALQNGINGGDNSITGAALMAVTLIVLNYLVAMGTARLGWLRWLVEGQSTLLAQDGVVDQRALRRELVSNDDFLKAMRIAGCAEVSHIRRAVLETNGHIVIETRDGHSG